MTDVWHDRAWLMQMMARNPRDPLRFQAETALKELDDEDQRQAREATLQEQIKSREGIANENRLQRESAASEGAANRAVSLKDTMTRHQDIMDARTSAENERVAQGLLTAAQVATNPAERTALIQEYYKRVGVTIPTAATGVHPAIQAFAGQQGATPTTPETQGSIPAADLTIQPPPSALRPETEQLAGGLVRHTLPSGGTATGVEPTTPEGVARINEARAAGAAREQYFAQNRPDVLGGQAPTAPTNLASAPFSPATLVAKPSAPNPVATNFQTNVTQGTGAPQAPPPKLAGTGVAQPTPTFAPGDLVANPQPNPTPAGTPQPPSVTLQNPFSLPNAPTATPVGTPPAIPPVKRALTDEEKKRQEQVGT